jgi:hypothetical protein
LITPIHTGSDSNPGWHFITAGIEHLVRLADPEAVFVEVNMLAPDPAWHVAQARCKGMFFCGNPRLNASEGKAFWDWNVWERIRRLTDCGIPLIDAWAGAAHPLPLPPLAKMVACISSLEKSKAILEHEKVAKLCIARDALAFELMKVVNPNTVLWPCSTWWAAAEMHVAPEEKKHNLIVVRRLGDWQIAFVKKWFDRLSAERLTHIVTHCYQDWEWFSKRLPQLPIDCVTHPRSLLRLLAQTDKLISFRTHASIPALSLGARVADVAIDSRSLTLAVLGVTCDPVDVAVRADWEPRFQTCNAPDAQPIIDGLRDVLLNKGRNGADNSRAKAVTRHTIDFDHGLGDCANFAQILPLWLSRGHSIGVRCRPDKAPLFRAAGAEIVTGAVQHSHPWNHAPAPGVPQFEDDWSGNKVAWNLKAAEMPAIGDFTQLWGEARESRVDFSTQVADADREFVERATDNLQRPLILLHTAGNTGPATKNLANEAVASLYRALLDRLDGTLILLDWDNRVPRLAHWRCRHLSELANVREFSLPRLWALMQQSKLLIGVDSGPLHFARLSDISVVGCWTKHFPTHYTLPNPRAVHFVTNRFAQWARKRRHWNILEAGDELDAHTIAGAATDILKSNGSVAYSKSMPRHLLLKHLIGKCRGTGGKYCDYVDRHRTFDAVLSDENLQSHPNPTILETGTIRAEEDWAGAGFSTFLWGAFIDGMGRGQVHSVDINGTHCEFARNWCTPWRHCLSVHQTDSIDFIRGFGQPIDILYLDSMDTDQPEHAQHCLAELQAAMSYLQPKSQILIDDTAWTGAWKGKGALAVPWALENGWRIKLAGYQCLLSRK